MTAKLFLFDPITTEKMPVTRKKIAGITGMDETYISYLKTNKMKVRSLNCYIIDDTFTTSDILKLISKENIPEEIWTKTEFEGYEASNFGRLKRKYSNGSYRIIKPYAKRNKRKRGEVNLYVHICDNGRQRTISYSRVIYFSFHKRKENHENLCIYHKDKNIYNNRIENLKLVSYSDIGANYATESARIAVIKIDPETGEELDSFDSMMEASKRTNVSYVGIRRCIQEKQKTAGKFKWIVDEEFTPYKNLEKHKQRLKEK